MASLAFLAAVGHFLGPAALSPDLFAGERGGGASRIDPASLKGSVPVEIVFLRDQGPLLVRMHVLQGNEPLQVRWQRYLNKRFASFYPANACDLGVVVLAAAANPAT